VKQTVRAGVLIALLWLAPRPAAAQFQFDSWTTENGLPQNSVNDILQTRDGYLWLATFGGLVRFDGVRFVVFDTSTDGIRSARARRLHEDAHGTLWAGTDDGMVIRYRDGRFRTYGRRDGLPFAAAHDVDDDAQGHLWIAWGASLTRLDGERFISYGPEHFSPQVLTHAGVVRTGETPTYPRRWWGQDAAGVHVLVSGRVHTYGYDTVLPRETEVTGVDVDANRTAWMHTSGSGLVRIGNDGKRAVIAREALPPGGTIRILMEDRDGFLWVVARDYTLHRIKDRTRSAIQIPAGVALEDREGSLWFGTVSGLFRLRRTTVTVQGEREGLSSNFVYSILQARGGAIWIGTWGGGLNRSEGARLTPFRYADGLPSDLITAIYEDRSGRLWAGTTAGLSYFDGSRFVAHHDEHGWLREAVWAIQEDRERRFWFGTDKGLVKLENGRYTRYTVDDGLSDDRVRALLEDRTGALWVGAYSGLTRMHAGRVTTYSGQDGLVGNNIRAIYEDVDGVVWIGTYDGGLYRIEHERLTRYTRKEGLHDNGVFQILEDHDGNLWMGSNRGISRVNRAELNAFAAGRTRTITPVVVGTKDGLSTLECNGGRQPAGLKTADGRLWFPTMGGVAVVDPRAVRLNTRPPPVIVEEFRRGGQPIEFAGGVRIQPSTTSFEINYTAPSFVEPAQVRFKYRLIGLDDDWIDAGSRRTASYHRIPPGRYRFVVTAANNDGVWNVQGTGLDIDVIPPVWRRWWFIAGALILAASAILVAHERRISAVRRERALQAMFSQQLIDSQEDERRRISMEMHDSFGQDLTIIKVRARSSRGSAPDNPALGRELDEIIAVADKAYAGIKEIAYDLRPYQLDIIGVSKTIDGMVKRVARTSGIAFTAEIENIDAAIDERVRIHLYRIVQEAVSNVVKHADARRASVAIARTGGSIEVRVEDDGRGFWPPTEDRAEAAGQGFGLVGMRERARIIGGELSIRSAPGQGTAIALTLSAAGSET